MLLQNFLGTLPQAASVTQGLHLCPSSCSHCCTSRGQPFPGSSGTLCLLGEPELQVMLGSITWEAGDAHSLPRAQSFPAGNPAPIPRHSLAEALQCWRSGSAGRGASGRVGIALITSQGWNSAVGSSQAPPRTIDFSMEKQFAKRCGGRGAEPGTRPGLCFLSATSASCWDTRPG